MNPVTILPWEIGRVSRVDDFSETIFFVGNGRLGARGFGAWEEKREPQAHAVFRAGLFSHIKPGITDMVQLPDALTLLVAGEAPDEARQRLDLQTGVMTHEWDSPRAAFRMQRAASMADERLLLERLTITARQDADFTAQAVQSALVANLPVHDDQAVEATELATLLRMDALDPNGMDLSTLAEGRRVFLRWRVACDRPAGRTDSADGARAVTTLRLRLRAGESATVEKRVWIDVDDAPATDAPGDPWRASAERWAALWRDCDVEVDADDPALQGALRYNIFQLLCNCAAADRRASIGARGLTHGRYKGNTFWDTDIFLLPFFLWTRPEAARNLLMYRVDRLDDARALARRQNLDGARFPWMCSDTGAEQCESWDIGLCETHVTADVAYALARYVTVAGDESILAQGGSELYRDTARYWRSRLTYEPDRDRFSSFFVKGPDEYCGAAINNTYTNYMARENLLLALRHGGLDEAEAAETRRVADKITLLYDEARGLYLQDEALERLPPFPRKDGDAPAYKSVCFDRMQRYRALKQADLVLLATLYPNDFTDEEKRAIFDTYEPITVHDSTLSYGAHALLALRLQKWDKADEYLPKAVYLDLRDIMGNTGHEGVHMAALGAAWQAFVFGMAGLWADGDGPTLSPRLTKGVHGMRFAFRYHGKRYRAEVARGAHSIREEA